MDKNKMGADCTGWLLGREAGTSGAARLEAAGCCLEQERQVSSLAEGQRADAH